MRTMMWQQLIQKWIRHPESLDGESLRQLKELLDAFPYFQTARLLYLKNLFLLGDPGFKEELQKGALFVADLSVLFYFIEGERFELKKHLPEAAGVSEAEGDRTLDLINRFLSDAEQAGDDGLLPLPVESSVDYTSVLLEEGEEDGGSALPLQGHELIDRFIENAGSEELLPDLPDGKPEECAAEAPPAGDACAKEDDTEEDESYFTETLAKIYVKQQRYDKALEIIKKLNLKYRKKNTYFADQMRFLEKLIINAKSK